MKIDIEEIKKFNVKEGDVLLFSINDSIPSKKLAEIHEQLVRIFKNTNVTPMTYSKSIVDKVIVVSTEQKKELEKENKIK